MTGGPNGKITPEIIRFLSTMLFPERAFWNCIDTGGKIMCKKAIECIVVSFVFFSSSALEN